MLFFIYIDRTIICIICQLNNISSDNKNIVAMLRKLIRNPWADIVLRWICTQRLVLLMAPSVRLLSRYSHLLILRVKVVRILIKRANSTHIALFFGNKPHHVHPNWNNSVIRQIKGLTVVFSQLLPV